MTVEELIAELREYDPKTTVRLWDGEWGPVEIEYVEWHMSWDSKARRYVADESIIYIR